MSIAPTGTTGTTTPPVTTPLSGLGQGTATTTTSGMPGMDQDMFLQILVAQLKYQNPMNPVDSQQYMAQASQLATVENLEQIATAQGELRAIQLAGVSSNMVGKTVKAIGADGKELVGTVQEVRFGGTEPQVVINGQLVPVGSVVSVLAEAPTPTDATPETGTDTDTASDTGTDAAADTAGTEPSDPAGTPTPDASPAPAVAPDGSSSGVTPPASPSTSAEAA